MTDSKKQLLDLMKRNGAVTVDIAVREIGLARTTLREHFLQMECDGYVTRKYVRNGPGRPSLQYSLTGKGNSLFPSSESELLRGMLKFLKEKGAEKNIEEFFELYWKERLKRAQIRMDEASETDLKKRVEALVSMLEEEGFMPEYDLMEKTLVIKECNCPFKEVIKETPLPCKLEALFYKKLFHNHAERTSYIGDGENACCYEIPLNQPITG